jgi:hypothetical protein
MVWITEKNELLINVEWMKKWGERKQKGEKNLKQE